MRVVVADASSLILLAQCSLLRDYSRRVDLQVPRQVIDEVASAPLVRRSADAALVAGLVEEGTVRAVEVVSRRSLPLALGPEKRRLSHYCCRRTRICCCPMTVALSERVASWGCRSSSSSVKSVKPRAGGMVRRNRCNATAAARSVALVVTVEQDHFAVVGQAFEPGPPLTAAADLDYVVAAVKGDQEIGRLCTSGRLGVAERHPMQRHRHGEKILAERADAVLEGRYSSRYGSSMNNLGSRSTLAPAGNVGATETPAPGRERSVPPCTS